MEYYRKNKRHAQSYSILPKFHPAHCNDLTKAYRWCAIIDNSREIPIELFRNRLKAFI